MFKRFFVTLTLLSVFGFSWYFQAIQPVTRQDTPTTDFEIKPSTGIDQIINDLSSARLVRSRVAFKLTVIRLGLASKIQAGYFKLSPNMNASELAQALTHAYARQFRVTIPEGLRSEEINLLLEKAFGKVEGAKYSSTEFATLAKDKEGRLFPDTYDFAPEASASDVLKKMAARFDEVTTEIPQDRLNQIITLASLLEREASTAKEMPQVAGVIQKRLDAGWPLQIDATIQYALGSVACRKIDCNWWKKDLTRGDLRLNSPYNTYLHPGLPPAPISNPGQDAIKAAASPVITSAWFYLHDLSGKIHFADTIDQHNQNICTYLKKDCP